MKIYPTSIVIVFVFLFIAVFALGQNLSDYKGPQTIQAQPTKSFSIHLAEAKDLTSPYYIPSADVYQLDEENEKLFVSQMSEVSRGLGFWVAQSEYLKMIGKQFPDLLAKCIFARDEFNKTIGPAIIQVSYILEDTSKKKVTLKSLRESIFAEIKKMVQRDPEKRKIFPWLYGGKIGRDESEAFISLVASRAKLESDYDIIKPLLVYHPSALSNPLGLVSDSFLLRYDFDSHPKAKGLSGWVRFPSHWTKKEGNQPNIVMKFVSPRDGAMFFVQVLSLPEEVSEGTDLHPLLADDEMLSQFAGQGKILDKRIVNLFAQNAIELTISISQETPMEKIFQEQIIYLVLYRKWMFGIYGGVVAMSEERAKKCFKLYKPLFQYLATMAGIKKR